MQSRNDVSLPLHSVLSMWAGTLPKLVTKAPEGEKKLLCNMHMYSIKSRTAYALILSKLSTGYYCLCTIPGVINTE